MTKYDMVKFGDLYAEPVRNGLTRPTRVRGRGYPMVNMGELFAHDRLDGQPMELVPLNERELRVATLKIGDLLFARSSLKIEGTGKCSIVVGLPDATTFESHLIRARLDRDRADPRFYFYFFRSYVGRATVLSIAKQVGAAGLPGSRLATLNVPCPPIAIQNTIADILWQYDDLIENNRRRIQLLEQAARLLYEEWFVHLRFPGHEHAAIGDGVPEAWEKKSLGELMEIRKGKNITRDSAHEGEIPVVAGGLTPAYFHDTSNAKGPVITISASGANAGHVNIYHEDIWASDCSYISAESTDFLYYYYLLLRSRQKEIYGLQKGAAQPHVYPKDVMRVSVFQPPDSVLRTFDEAVSNEFHLVSNLIKQNKSLTKARNLLLPRLMNGEVAV